MDSLFADYGYVDVVAIRYHGNWPWSFDPFYNANPQDIDDRYAYYSIGEMGTMIIDGEVFGRTCFVETVKGLIDSNLAETSPLKLVATDSLSGDSCFVDIKVIAEDNPLADSLKLRVAVIEDSIYYEAPNGQTIFNWTFRSFVPDPDGLSFDIAQGETLDFALTYQVDAIWDVTNISAIVFVQSDTDQRVLQAVSSKPRPPAWARYSASQRGKVASASEDVIFPGSFINLGSERDTFDIYLSTQLPSDWIADYEILGGTALANAVALESDSSCVINVRIRCGYESGTGRVTLALKSRQDTSFMRSPGFFAISEVCGLIVDDDGGQNLEQYFSEALDSLGIVWGWWERSIAKPALDDLSKPNFVIWLTGEAVPTLDAHDQQVLASYLGRDGKLFITGQDIGYQLCYVGSEEYSPEARKFYETYLHAKYVMPNANLFDLFGRDGDPISDGISLSIEGGDGANNQRYPDVIDSIAPARVIFDYSDTLKHGGVRFDSDSSKVVYLSFGFEGISSAADRILLLSRIVNWFGETARIPDEPPPGLVISCYPNPCTSYATLSLSEGAGHALFEIYDVMGRVVRKEEITEAKVFVWDLRDAARRKVSPGIYFVSVSTQLGTARRKIILLR